MNAILFNVSGLKIGLCMIIVFGIVRFADIFTNTRLFTFILLFIKAVLYSMLAIWIGAYLYISHPDKLDAVTCFTFLFCCVEAVSNLADATEAILKH